MPSRGCESVIGIFHNRSDAIDLGGHKRARHQRVDSSDATYRLRYVAAVDSGLSSADRIAVVAAFVAPAVSLPLIGPWVLHAVLPEDSSARPHVARAFDLQLATTVTGFGLLGLGTFFSGYGTAEILVGILLLFSIVGNVVLLAGIFRGARWSAPWNPVVLSHRSVYHQPPFIR